MIVFIINGAPRTGKDTFINLVRKLTKEKVIAYSSIDWVKQMAMYMGWDGKKDTKGRKFLSDIKDTCTEYADIPFQKIVKTLTVYEEFPEHAPRYFCTNIREPLEIQKLVDWCKERKIPCYTVWIRQQKAEQIALDNFLSSGDTQFAEYNYDWIINNDGTIKEFEQEIEFRLNKIGEGVAA